MQITAKFTSFCRTCGAELKAGAVINWSKQTGGYCLECQAPTQLLKKKTKRYRTRRPRYPRYNSGHESFTNARGRCIDAPCCGCCSTY